MIVAGITCHGTPRRFVQGHNGGPRTTHGLTGSREYIVWTAIKARCFNENDDAYASYGGRGITMCERWNVSFENFLADMGPRPEGKSIERINNEGN